MGIEILRRLAHRGAAGCDPCSSDGAGILHPDPPRSLRADSGRTAASSCPLAGDYGVAQCFLSRDPRGARAEMRTLEDAVRHHNQKVIGWRDVPDRRRACSAPSRARRCPCSSSSSSGACARAGVFERTLFMIRKRAGRRATRGRAWPASTSRACRRRPSSTRASRSPSGSTASTSICARTRRAAAGARPLALQHEHVSHLGARAPVPPHRAQRRDQHAARQPDVDGARASRCSPARRSASTWPTSSPSSARAAATRRRSTTWSTSSSPAAAACPHVMMMLVPEAWEGQDDMPAERRAFYEYHASLVEPWDGPAALLFTDGQLHRRDARSQRPAPAEVRRDRERLRRRGERARRARLRAGGRPREGPPPAGQDAPRRPGAAGASSATTRSSARSRRRSRTRSGSTDNKLDLATLPVRRARAADARADERAPPHARRSATRARTCGCSSTPMATSGEEPTGQHGQRRAARRPQRPAAARSSGTSSSSSRR